MTEKLRKSWLAQQKASDKLRSLATDATAETRAAAEAEFNAAASGLQVVLDQEPDETPASPDAESAELRRLQSAASLGKIVQAAVERRSLDGAEAELQQHCGINGNQIPLELLREPETRAVTPGPTTTGATENPVLLPIFARGDAAFLQIPFPTVPAGDSIFPVLSTRPAIRGPFRDSSAAAETTGAFSVDSLTPSRLQASFFWLRTDQARFSGLATSLRQALNESIGEALDDKIVAQIVADVPRVAASSADNFDSYRARFIYAQLDGRFASNEADLRVLAGADTVADAAALFRSATGDFSAVDSLRRITGGLRVSAHVPPAGSSLQDVIIRRGVRRDAVSPVWEGLTLLEDSITLSDKGQLKLSVIALAAFKVVRTGGFARVQAQFA